MPANSALLCIHRDPAQLSLLSEHGYDLATATTGSDGLKLFMSRPVDAVVLEYHLGLMDGAAIANEIKRVRPEVPIVMVVDHVELPVDALKSVDAVVVKSDGPDFLVATLHFVLHVKPAQRQENRLRSETPAHLRCAANRAQLATDRKEAPFSREVWRSIQNGSVQF